MKTFEEIRNNQEIVTRHEKLASKKRTKKSLNGTYGLNGYEMFLTNRKLFHAKYPIIVREGFFDFKGISLKGDFEIFKDTEIFNDRQNKISYAVFLLHIETMKKVIILVDGNELTGLEFK